MIKYKDLRNEKIVSFDIETFDPNLRKMGNGVYRKDGYVLGYSFADRSGWKEYFNLGHEGITDEEYDKNIDYLKEQLSYPNIKAGTNLVYDVDWVENFLGIPVNGKLYDIRIAEALLDENLPKYNLDSIALKYLGVQKTKGKLERICEENNWKGDFRAHLYKMSYKDVREYGQDDAEYPLRIIQKQLKLMEAQELLNVFELESMIIRVILLMRKNGVRINERQRLVNTEELSKEIKKRKVKLYNNYGEFNYNSSPQIARVLDSLGATYPLTEKGNPRLDSKVLSKLSKDYPICKDIIEVKRLDKNLGTFIDGAMKRFQVNNRIHCSFYNTKTEREGGLAGTVTGRFSSASPNLQQIPFFNPDEDDPLILWYTRLARELFIPEENHIWGSIDYSQIEYRFMAHFAINAGPFDHSAEDVRFAYNENPYTDYHKMIQDLTGLQRKDAKTLNFGIGYGMGRKKMAIEQGWSMEYVNEVTNTYHSKAPFIKATMNAVGAKARRQGFIRTFMKRRRRLTDPRFDYRMFNALCQGSAADLMKKALVDSYEAGIYDILKLHLTVHDEIDFSMPKTKKGVEALKEQKYIMENALKLRVPIIADVELGDNWAELVNMKEGLKRYGLAE